MKKTTAILAAMCVLFGSLTLASCLRRSPEPSSLPPADSHIPSPEASAPEVTPSETPQAADAKRIIGLMYGYLTSDGAYSVMYALDILEAFMVDPNVFVSALTTFSEKEQDQIIKGFISEAVFVLQSETGTRLRAAIEGALGSEDGKHDTVFRQMLELFDERSAM
jgi:hypothetical protein